MSKIKLFFLWCLFYKEDIADIVREFVLCIKLSDVLHVAAKIFLLVWRHSRS